MQDNIVGSYTESRFCVNVYYQYNTRPISNPYPTIFSFGIENTTNLVVIVIILPNAQQYNSIIIVK